MKKIIVIVIVIMLILAVYKNTRKEEFLSFSLGGIGDIIYEAKDKRITDIIIDIESNIEIDGRPIQNILVKASEIEIDLNQFITLKTYDSAITQMKDLEVLFSLLKKYCKENISVILIRGDNELTEYTNQKIAILTNKYDIMLKR
jgi:citrate lyase alpha subunit